DFSSIHWEDPDPIGISRMGHNWKTDVANRFGHVLSDAQPGVCRPVDSVNSAVVLLIEPVRIERMQDHAVRIVSKLDVLIGQEIRSASLIEGVPVSSAVCAFKNSTHRNSQVHVLWISRINQNGVHQLPARSGALLTPLAVHRMLIE